MNLADTVMPIYELKKKLFFAPNSNCPLASTFGNISVPLTKAALTVGKACPSVKQTCCEKGWIETFRVDSKLSELNLRSKYKNSYRLNRFMIDGVHKNMKYHPDDKSVLECQGQINEHKCASLWLNIQRSTARAKLYYDDWIKNWTTCRNHKEHIRSEIKCLSCDVRANKYISYTSRKIVINKSVVNGFVLNCFNSDLFWEKAMRGVFQAYLNYARHLVPTLDVTDKILWSGFPSAVKECSEWIQYTQSNSSSDFTKSRGCLKYVYLNLDKVLQKASEVRLSKWKWNFFTDVIAHLITPDALEQMNA